MLRSTMNVIAVGIGAAAAQLVRGAADGDEVARLEQRERVGVGDPLAVERLVEDRASSRLVDASPSDRRLRGDEAQLGHLVELADLVGELEERVEAGALARAEAVAELLEVAGEEAGRVAVALGRLVRERLRARRARRGPTRRARPRARAGPGCGGSGAAQTANTIGSPVRSSQSRPRSWCGVGSSNADFSAASPISSFASASSPSGTCVGVGQQHLREHDRGRRLGRDGDGADASSGVFETSWIESTAPSDETQSRGSSRSESAWRAYSIDEIGAVSSSPATSRRLSSVGTPMTSSYSASTRKKTGAMFAYAMRPSRITRAPSDR